jgi:hypothetical protein
MLSDLRLRLRVLCKNPGFAIVAVLTLSLGVGSSAIIYSLVDTILLRPLPYPNAGRVAMLWQVAPAGSFFGTRSIPWEPREFRLPGKASTAFQNLGAFKKQFFNLAGVTPPERLEGVRVSAGFFPALGVSPLLGRTFDPSEEQQGHEYVAVPSQIFILILRQADRVVCSGIAIGLLAAFLTLRLKARFLYGGQPTDPVTFAAVALLQLVVAALACYLPARKTMSVNSVTALCYE